MREYYYYSYIVMPISEQAKKFSKKYMSASQGFRYETLFNVGYINGIYFYKEDGKFYEFFSGYQLGVEEKSTHYKFNYISIKSQLYGNIIIETNNSDNDIMSAIKLTQPQFAAEIKPYLKYTRKISAIMNKYFDLLHQQWVEDNSYRSRIKSMQKSHDCSDDSWIDDYLDKRNS